MLGMLDVGLERPGGGGNNATTRAVPDVYAYAYDGGGRRAGNAKVVGSCRGGSGAARGPLAG